MKKAENGLRNVYGLYDYSRRAIKERPESTAAMTPLKKHDLWRNRMNLDQLRGVHGLFFYEGQITPEGKIVTRYRSPQFDPFQFDTEELDWGELNDESMRLAHLLIRDAGSFHWPWPKMEEEFAELVIAKLPRDAKWRLWRSEVSHFREKIFREHLAGREWPACDYR